MRASCKLLTASSACLSLLLPLVSATSSSSLVFAFQSDTSTTTAAASSSGSALNGTSIGSNSSSSSDLSTLCSPSYALSALPASLGNLAITIDESSIETTLKRNYSVSGSVMYPDAVFDYCNVTLAYSHNGRNDRVLVTYWLPTPANFQRRFLATGGGGLAINSGSQSVAGGVSHGAVSGLTDGGFGGFSQQFDSVFLLANGTVDWEKVFLFGYEAIHEMTVLGLAFARGFFQVPSGEKVWSYYQGCSEGGREGWSQVQRYRQQFDGVVVGAPALRYSFQQVQHLYSNVVEQTLGYYPSPCELDRIVNLTIAACDPMDGLTDGIVSRTDLCKLNFNTSSLIGQPYYCAASSPSSGPPGGGGGGFPGGPSSSSSTPAQNGTISARAVAVADTIIRGLRDTQGRQVYLSYQPTAPFSDGQTQYNNLTHSWNLSISGLGGEWVARFLQLQNASTLPTLANVTYDTLAYWMISGLQRYQDSLQTTWPDLLPYASSGGKVLHYHGESDDSIPPASSVRYFDSVRSVMYPGLDYNASVRAMGDWYRLFLVPGAAHCAPSELQSDAAFPQTNLRVMIDWAEGGVVPEMLNATVLTGERYRGENRRICGWPLRPLWTAGNGTGMSCVYDQRSIDSWHYDFDGVGVPVY